MGAKGEGTPSQNDIMSFKLATDTAIEAMQPGKFGKRMQCLNLNTSAA